MRRYAKLTDRGCTAERALAAAVQEGETSLERQLIIANVIAYRITFIRGREKNVMKFWTNSE